VTVFEHNKEAKRVRDRAITLMKECEEAWEDNLLSAQIAMYILNYLLKYLKQESALVAEVKDCIIMSAIFTVQILNLLTIIYPSSYDSVSFYIFNTLQVVLLIILMKYSTKYSQTLLVLKTVTSENDDKLNEITSSMRDIIAENKIERI